MHRFLTQILVCSFFSILLVSCKSFALENVTSVSTDKKEVENLYFSSPEDYLYKCQMEVYGNDISGIVIIKKLSNDAHRVVMTTDFGNKMIDFEISENDFKLNYVLPDLDKKMVINFLKNDFRILLQKKYAVTESFQNENSKIYTSKKDKNTSYLFFDKESNVLKNMIITENSKEKIHFTFAAKKHIFADEIDIQHKDFKIKIKLTQITKENESI